MSAYSNHCDDAIPEADGGPQEIEVGSVFGHVLAEHLPSCRTWIFRFTSGSESLAWDEAHRFTVGFDADYDHWHTTDYVIRHVPATPVAVEDPFAYAGPDSAK